MIDSELKDWFKHFDIIMNLFLSMRRLQESGSVTATDYMKQMFQRIISYIPKGSGGDKILGGWIRLFTPYTSKNKLIDGLQNNIKCLDLTQEEPTNKDYSYYHWQAELDKFYIAGGWTNMISSLVTTPAKLIYYGAGEFKVEFYSGFFNPYMNSDNVICMNMGYILR